MKIELPSVVTDPATTTPARPERSVRLTSHMDIEPHANAGLHLRGATRSLRTSAERADVVAAATVDALVDANRILFGIETSPADARTASLVGRSVGRGFRSAVEEAFAQEGDPSGSLHILLDDLPVAVLISGYASLYSGAMQIERKHLDAGLLRPDICAGWGSDGTMLSTLRAQGHLPVPMGPRAQALEPADDPLAWHEMGALPPETMRRRRLVEVSDVGALEMFAMFRDTHVDEQGEETVLHEYSLTAVLDAETATLSACRARPHVLPWPECPTAATSVRRLDGHRLDELPKLVSHELRGTSTCTHLNDLLRSLARIESLLPHLPGTQPRT